MDTPAATDKTVLVVEDNAISREGLGVILRRAGHTVRLTNDGQEALACLHEGLRPAVILLDMLVPRLDGWEFLRQRQRDPVLAGIPILITTGLSIASREWAESLGAAGYLPKPLEVKALLEAIRQCCKPG